MTRQDSRVVVIDSAMQGSAKRLPHSIYAVVYLPSWLRIKFGFKWATTMEVVHTLSVMKEYFVAAEAIEKPFRAQRCLYSLRALQIYGYKTTGRPRFAPLAQNLLTQHLENLRQYLVENPVVAWDWVVSWSECQAMAEAYPKEFVSMYRQLRVHYGIKKQPKPELLYFIHMMETVAKEKEIDMEHKP